MYEMYRRDVLEAIEQTQSGMTKSEKKIAQFVLNKRQEAQYMSITSLAEECGVAEATVSRFCKTMGYDGYNEFKLALAKAGARSEAAMEPCSEITEEDSVVAAAHKLYATDITALRETLELLNEEAVARAVQYFLGAQRVFCFGQGGSGVMAAEAHARFSLAAPNFQWIQDSHLQAMAVSLCALNDVVLFFSYSGATKEITELLRLAKAQGAKVVLVTHFANSPAVQYADVVLLCGSRETPLQTGSVAAKMGQLFLIDVLYTEYCRANPAFTARNREATAAAIASKLL